MESTLAWRDATWTGEDNYDPVNHPRPFGPVEIHVFADGSSRVGYIDDDSEYLEELHERGQMTSFGTHLVGFEPRYNLESLEDYRPGGYHPVHLRDELGPEEAPDRYRVLHKLGHGDRSTVWLCRDSRMKPTRYVALKVMKAEVAPEDVMECEMSARVHRGTLDRWGAGSDFVNWALHTFVLQGPNGSHQCQTFPVYGHSIGPGMWTEWDDERDEEAPRVLREMAHSATKGLAFLHDNRICHGDLRPENIRVKLTGLDILTEEQILRMFGRPRELHVIRTRTTLVGDDGIALNDDCQPRYLVHAYHSGCLSNDPIGPQYVSDDVVVTGLSWAFFVSSTGDVPEIEPELAFLPPELLCGIPAEELPRNTVGFASDLWALGCSLASIRTQRRFVGGGNDEEDTIVAMIVAHFGFDKRTSPAGDDEKDEEEPATEPPFWWKKWLERGQWFEESGKPKPDAFEDLREEEDDEKLARLESVDGILEPQLAEEYDLGRRTLTITPREAELLADLVRKLCRYEPDKRLTAQEAVNHPFFTENL